jgi:hypothetical protein
MKDETALKRDDLVPSLKAHLGPAFVVFRHEDLFTGGIADISVTGRGRTSWVEVKILKAGESLRKCVRGKAALQLATMEKLAIASDGRAWYVIYDLRKPKAPETLIYAPSAVRSTLAPLALPSDSPWTLSDLFRVYRAYTWPGLQHQIVAELIRETHGA